MKKLTAYGDLPHRFCRLLLLIVNLLTSLLIPRLSLVALRELYLSLFFRLSGLSPVTIPVSPSNCLHIWLPTRRSPVKPPLLLIHGFGCNAKWQFHCQIRVLSRSFDLYIPDLIFFGRSVSSCRDRSVAFQSQCLAMAMKDLGVERYSVVGISYGGFIAFRLAAEEAKMEVDRVVILSSGICATAEEKREMVQREKRDVSEIFLPQRAEDLMILVRRSMHRPPTWMPAFFLRDVVEFMYKDRRQERVELLRELLSNGVDLLPLPVLDKEILIIWGDKDTVFPVSLAYSLQRHLGHTAKLEVIQSVGHALQLEAPNLVNELIKGFILGNKML